MKKATIYYFLKYACLVYLGFMLGLLIGELLTK